VGIGDPSTFNQKEFSKQEFGKRVFTHRNQPLIDRHLIAGCSIFDQTNSAWLPEVTSRAVPTIVCDSKVDLTVTVEIAHGN